MPPKILLVDDREDNLLSLETILQPGGYRFVKAGSGRQVLKILLSEFDFALILMDVKMPNLNGFETASLIYEREKLKHIPIIFITANNYGEEYIFKGYRAGAVDYIFKPVNPELLRAKVSVFIDLYTKNQRLIAQEQKLVSINRSLEKEITERISSEQKIIELNHSLLENISRLESANKDLDLFAFMASHDLQAPLRKLHMFSDRLYVKYKEQIDPDGMAYLQRIQQECRRMQELINDVLEFSKISVEKKSFSDIDMGVLLKELITELEPVIREKNARIILEKIPSLHINASLMRQLFSNLFSNALKYGNKNGETVIKIYSENSPGSNGKVADKPGHSTGYCRIIVEDNGIGFDQKYAEEIFEMFRRLHPRTEYEGTGIGLALCKKIVEKHNGFISARGKPGEGASFIVSLPYI
jgi:signal transduction histidine kinase